MKFLWILFPIILSSCAVLHHAQLGSIDNAMNSNEISTPIDIKISETGVNGEEAALIAQQNDIALLIALFQFGNRTGNPVYSEKYAEGLIQEIHRQCPHGKIVNLLSVRETRKYPVISGEIVKVIGECRTLENKGS